MKRHNAVAIAVAAIAFAHATGVGAQSDDAGVAQKLELTAAQRNAIYAAVSKDRSKMSPQRFPAVIGAEVPPMINLYALPDDIVASNASAKLYQCIVVEDKVVLVDPTRMRVVDTIGPLPQQ
jgi:sulfur transfer complex TusBCD TusB component (DsrH family)